MLPTFIVLVTLNTPSDYELFTINKGGGPFNTTNPNIGFYDKKRKSLTFGNIWILLA